ncbi:hypothetical protein [Lutibacter sp.]|uniref:hypothetical protein n=1 Tax=Lutibacter sp. TaxID=1925666 RepID=UPI0035679578
MKKIITIFVLLISVVSCKNDELNPDRFKTGTFEIPEGKGYEKTIITRQDSLQIEKYEDKIDTLSISWKDNFNYTLKMINPKTAIDEDPIHIKITRIQKDSYEFEAVIGHSNYVQKGKLIKTTN